MLQTCFRFGGVSNTNRWTSLAAPGRRPVCFVDRLLVAARYSGKIGRDHAMCFKNNIILWNFVVILIVLFCQSRSLHTVSKNTLTRNHVYLLFNRKQCLQLRLCKPEIWWQYRVWKAETIKPEPGHGADCWGTNCAITFHHHRHHHLILLKNIHT